MDNMGPKIDEHCKILRLENSGVPLDVDKLIKIGAISVLVGGSMLLFGYIGKDTIPTTNGINAINNIGLCTLGCGMAIMVVVFG